ncbi:MAG: 50S ribosomal protein L21, partial [Candidatus Kapabacteria bacterium]|nr:50S ribosomal protein L21 [Candidatus Kapabacteria bacterium]
MHIPMRVIVEIAANQFPVEIGTTLRVPRLPADPGSMVEFHRILMAEDPAGTVHVGTPYIAGTVQAEILEHGKSDKVIVFKKKRRKG